MKGSLLRQKPVTCGDRAPGAASELGLSQGWRGREGRESQRGSGVTGAGVCPEGYRSREEEPEVCLEAPPAAGPLLG